MTVASPSKRGRQAGQRGVFPATQGVVVTGSAQTVSPPSRWLVVSTAGTITGKLVDDATDVAYVLPVGRHPMAFKSITSTSSLVGVLLR